MEGPRERAEAVTAALRQCGLAASVVDTDIYTPRVQVRLPDGRQVRWEVARGAPLRATVLLNGNLVGFVPPVDGAEQLDTQALAAAILDQNHIAPTSGGPPGVGPPVTAQEPTQPTPDDLPAGPTEPLADCEMDEGSTAAALSDAAHPGNRGPVSGNRTPMLLTLALLALIVLLAALWFVGG